MEVTIDVVLLVILVALITSASIFLTFCLFVTCKVCCESKEAQTDLDVFVVLTNESNYESLVRTSLSRYYRWGGILFVTSLLFRRSLGNSSLDENQFHEPLVHSSLRRHDDQQSFLIRQITFFGWLSRLRSFARKYRQAAILPPMIPIEQGIDEDIEIGVEALPQDEILAD